MAWGPSDQNPMPGGGPGYATRLNDTSHGTSAVALYSRQRPVASPVTGTSYATQLNAAAAATPRRQPAPPAVARPVVTGPGTAPATDAPATAPATVPPAPLRSTQDFDFVAGPGPTSIPPAAVQPSPSIYYPGPELFWAGDPPGPAQAATTPPVNYAEMVYGDTRVRDANIPLVTTRPTSPPLGPTQTIGPVPPQMAQGARGSQGAGYAPGLMPQERRYRRPEVP